MNNSSPEIIIAQAVRMREEARATLDQLIRARTEIDTRATGADPMRIVTGRSSLDTAVDSARRMLERVERSIDAASERSAGSLDGVGRARHRADDEREHLDPMFSADALVGVGADASYPSA